ncbi:TPM domain-containing protein [Pandoraea nosoerga]|nr:TPM domain-containing protein [Pandoraea nosoerga]
MPVRQAGGARPQPRRRAAGGGRRPAAGADGGRAEAASTARPIPLRCSRSDALEAAIRASEREHRCEIRLVIEAAMPLAAVWQGQSCRQRAVHLFRELGIAHTGERTGILLYINVADHDIELVADKGVNALVPARKWDAVVAQMSAGFRDERYVESVLGALDTLRGIARESLPAHAGAESDNALTDRPLMI